jgi:hypothetical protein
MAVRQRSRAARLQLIRCQQTAYPRQKKHACMHAKMCACSFLRASLAVASNQAGASLELKGRSARARDNRWDSRTATPRAEKLAGPTSSWQGGRSAQQGAPRRGRVLSNRAARQHTHIACGHCSLCGCSRCRQKIWHAHGVAHL